VPLHPHTPVLVGTGQVVHRAAGLDDALEPAELMARAVREALGDAGLGSLNHVPVLRVVSLLSWRYRDPARFVAERAGLTVDRTGKTTNGGNSPQTLVNATARQIQAGELDMAVLTGGEAFRTRMRARKTQAALPWPEVPEGVEPDEILGEDLVMNHPHEIERQITMPVQIYPLFETALRAEAGRSVEHHQVFLSELWARFSEVASRNPYAWVREGLTAEQIRTPGPSNRMIGFPYPKYMNSNNDVDMAAALIMCSAERAQALGIPRDRWVFVHSGTDCHEHPFVSNRFSFTRTPAIEIGGRQALELAGLGIDDVDLVDLYSCFPSAVQLGARSLGLSLDRQLTRTGGLPFAGGPWNNYVMHAIATVARELRHGAGSTGLVWANGGYATKHAFGVYGTQPPPEGFRHAYPQDEIDALPRRELALPTEVEGPATIEGYSVMHTRDGDPERVIATCLLADGRRVWGTNDDSTVAGEMCAGEWVGTTVGLGPDGTLHVG